MDVTLHPTPRWRDVVLEQVRIVGLSLRWEALIFAVVLGVGTLVIGSELITGGPAFDSYETFPTALVAFLFPFAVWKGDRRFGSSFLWTLPVDRRRLALAKVFAGWVWLMAALAIFASWLLALALLAHATLALSILRIPLAATIAAYLFGSALVVGLRHPLRWLLGAAGLFFLLGMLRETLRHGPYDINAFLISSGVVSMVEDAAAQWAITTLLGLGAGLAALWAAISRHRENR
jgi:hypothetical protein